MEAGARGEIEMPETDPAIRDVTGGCAFTGLDRPAPLAGEREQYLRAALRGDRRAALARVEALLAHGCALPTLYASILQEAQYEVGALWERNLITVAQEHMATAVTQYVLARLSLSFPGRAGHRGRVLITGIRGEFHQVGPHMVADMLEFEGWDVRFLGTNLPEEAILRALEDDPVDVVGISATMIANIPAVSSLAEGIRKLGAGTPRIVVGGAAFRAAPDLWRELGADGAAADLQGSVDLLERLAART